MVCVVRLLNHWGDGTHFLQCISRFSQGLRLRQVDLVMDDIAGSSATLSKGCQTSHGGEEILSSDQ